MKNAGNAVFPPLCALLCCTAFACGDDSSSSDPGPVDSGADTADVVDAPQDTAPDLSCADPANKFPKVDPLKVTIGQLSKTVEITAGGIWNDPSDPTRYIVRLTDGNDRCDKFNARQIVLTARIPKRGGAVCGIDGDKTYVKFTYDLNPSDPAAPILDHMASGEGRISIGDLTAVGGLTQFKVYAVAPPDGEISSNDTADGTATVTICE